jgi:hypothetical protein
LPICSLSVCPPAYLPGAITDSPCSPCRDRDDAGKWDGSPHWRADEPGCLMAAAERGPVALVLPRGSRVGGGVDRPPGVR